MIFLFFKLLMLALSYKFHLIKKEPYFSALLFSVSLGIIGLIMGNSLIGVFVGSAILFAFSFLCYWLIDKVPNGMPHYSVMAVATFVVIFLL